MDSIAEWMSSVLEKPVDHDLATSLEDGIVWLPHEVIIWLFLVGFVLSLHEVLSQRFPEQLAQGCLYVTYVSPTDAIIAKFAIYKRDNVWAFIDGCKKIGIPSNSIIDYTYFESKNVYDSLLT